jgi:hypothetical protein
MQTFLPYADLTESLRVLDNKRLGKQRVETYQIISAITGRLKLDGTPYKGWVNHPCSVMWRNHVPLLKMYLNASIDEWVSRGFKNTMDKEDIDEEVTYPDWFGNQKFHDSHKSNLLKKDFDFYSSNIRELKGEYILLVILNHYLCKKNQTHEKLFSHSYR